MAYFIFLKSMRILGEFWKNPHVKIPPKSPCANSKAFVYSKIQILFRNNSPQLSAQPRPIPFFLSSNRPIFPPLPTGPRPPGRPNPPSRPNRPSVIFFLPHRSQARSRRWPASHRLRGHPDISTGREKRLHLFPIHFPSLISTIPPSSIPETGAFNPAIETPSIRPLKALGPLPPRLRPIKADPALGEASHTSNAPSLSPQRAVAVVL
jgi:hypothetical protein